VLVQDKLIRKYMNIKKMRISKVKEKMELDGFSGKRIKGVINAIRNVENTKIKKITEMVAELKNQGISRSQIEDKVGAFVKTQDKSIKRIIQKNNIEGIDLKEINLMEYVILTGEEKALLAQELLKNGNMVKLQTSDDIIAQMNIEIPVQITKHKQFVEYIQRREDIFMSYFKAFTDWKIGKFYDCIISVGNFAWISKDDKGITRYFSKNPNDGKSFGLNIFDLIEIRENNEIGTSISFKNARRILVRDLNITYEEREWECLQEERYINNIKEIRAFIDMKSYYPNLYKLTQNYLHILEHFNAWAMANIAEKRETINGEAVFFCSLRYAEKFIKRDHSVISKAINLFTVLGLINKVDSEKVSKDMLSIAREISQKAKKTANSIKNVELVNFYSIPLYNAELLINAERISTKLIENKVTNASRVNKKVVEEIFGDAFAKKVYPKIEAVDIYSVDNLVRLIERGL